MERIEEYRKHIEKLFLERENLGSMRPGVETEAILDRERDRYQLVRVGWQDNNTRVYGCLLHVDIKDGKIWIQEDGGEEAIADQLVAMGVPAKDIVLGYHAPHVRQYTEFAVS
ncbi:MAG: XisI protein [Cyanobacteria bacterium P01_H01_bin.21]